MKLLKFTDGTKVYQYFILILLIKNIKKGMLF